MKHDVTVDAGAAGERLDVFLATALGLTRSQVQRIIRTGGVLVNDIPERTGYLTKVNDHILVTQPEVKVAHAQIPSLDVIYEDNDIIVIDKPAGLTVHHGRGTAGKPTVADYAREHTTDMDPDRPGIVHRLDQDTSGLLVLAKTPAAKIFMQQQFSERKVHKTYVALLVGRLDPDDAIIRLPTGRDPARPLRRAVIAGGRDAVTRYHSLANLNGYTLVEAKPETGRTHQIRVHFATVGHPVAGDTTYGPTDRPLGLKRHFLHAKSLEFTAPSGKSVVVTSPLPPDLDKVLHALGGSGIIV